MTATVVRPAEPGETDAVLRLWQSAHVAPSPTDDQVSIARFAATGSGVLLVAERSGRLVGTVIAAWDGWRGHFYRLAVSPEHRRRGIARRLVEEGERRLAAMGAVRVDALVLGERASAMGFWEAVGYHPALNTLRFVRTALDQHE